MKQLTFVENNYHELSIDCKLRKIHFLTESANRNAFNQPTISTIFFSAQIQFTIPHVSSPQSIVPINQPVDQGIRHATEHATGHATENSIEYAIIQPSEHQSERRSLIQSARRPSRILSENEEFEEISEPQFLRYQPNSRNDVRYQSNSRNDVRYQSDPRDNRYQPNSRDEARSNRDRNEAENGRYNSRSQDARKQQKFYYEDIYQQQPSLHSAVESVHQSAHQSVHSLSFRTLVRSHTPQIQSIRRPIPQRPHTAINQPSPTFQNPSFHRATDQPGTLPQISQSRYVSAPAAPPAPTYVSATSYAPATGYAPVNTSAYASGNASAYAPAYAPATGYGPATNHASRSAAAPARAFRSEMTVLD